MSLGISYTPIAGTPVYDITIKEFTDNSLPRLYDSQIAYGTSVTGASVLEGPAFAQKYIWTISAHFTKEKALELDAMFRAWDEDRSTGANAALGLIDRTFGPEVNTTVLFSSAPSFVYLSPSVIVGSFGLSEI